MKIVINKCFGGFSLSPEAALWLHANGFDEEGFVTPVEKYWTDMDREYPAGTSLGHKGQLKEWRCYLATKPERRPLFMTPFTPDEKAVLDTRPANRAHPLLVKCVEEMGDKANGGCARLRVVEIPDGVEWEIDEYDGMESVHEKHRSWG